MYETKIKFLKLGIAFTELYRKYVKYRYSSTKSDEKMDDLYHKLIGKDPELDIRDVFGDICIFANDITFYFNKNKVIDIFNDIQMLYHKASIKEEDLNLDETMFYLSYGRILDQIGETECEKYISFFEQIL